MLNLKLKCTKLYFGCMGLRRTQLGSLQYFADSLSGFKGPGPNGGRRKVFTTCYRGSTPMMLGATGLGYQEASAQVVGYSCRSGRVHARQHVAQAVFIIGLGRLSLPKQKSVLKNY